MAKVILNTGPVPCYVMVVAERPGIEEARRGTVLCGPSGQELDRYLLNDSGIDRANVYCTNLVKDYRDGENPEEWEVVRDWPKLVEEFGKVRPKYVMALGAWSARALLGMDIELDWANGLYFPNIRWEICGRFTVMPVIHTAAGLHQPSIAGKIAHGFRQFGKLIRGETLPTGHWRDSYPTPRYFEGNGKVYGGIVGADTEGSVEHPWCVSYSGDAGKAWVERTKADKKLPCTVVLHNAIHDLPVMAAMEVRPSKITDTMLMAALLGTEPLGLKALARRYCGMKMREYGDVVREARREKALEYLGKVLEVSNGE